MPKKTPNGRWLVDSQGRGSDGCDRRIRATGDTPESAVVLWKAKHEIYGGYNDFELTAGSRFETAARLWVSARLLEAQTAGGRVRVQSVEKDRRTLRADIVPSIGALALDELTTPRLERWLASIKAEDGARHTLVDKRRKCRSIVKQVLDYAIRMGAISGHNPVVATTSPPRQKSRPRALTPREIHSLREAVRGYRSERKARYGPAPSPHLPVLVDLLLGSGCRIGEALALRWSEVQLSSDKDGDSTMTIVATMTTVDSKEVRQEITKSERACAPSPSRRSRPTRSGRSVPTIPTLTRRCSSPGTARTSRPTTPGAP
ncbi:site-specific integrase [Cellulosimicrobium funkei]